MLVDLLKKQRGFTLAEVLVSIFIIALITGLFLTNYHGTNKRTELNMAAQKVVSDIRLAQNNSLGSLEFNGSIPAGGWGIYFATSTSDSYVIFADINDNKDYDLAEQDRQINLPTGIFIDSIVEDGGELEEVAITFLPPDPVTYINGLADNTVQIILKDNANNSIKTIKVNFFGLVDAVD